VAGDRVAVVAPASRYDSERLARGIEVLESWGLAVENLAPTRNVRYLAGSDDERAERLTEAFVREDIAAILTIRGGFGSSRLLGRFDPAVAASHPKIFVGYSDVTVLLSRLRREAGLVCFHGPMVASDLGRLPIEQLESFRRFLFAQEGWWAGSGLQMRAPGSATGRLVGGCLSVIATTIGTPYEIDTRGGVLFLEDIAKPPYRIDRLLTHLVHAHKFDGVAAVVLGTFHNCDPPDAPGQVMQIADEILGRLGIPVVSAFDSGHHSGGAVLPLGCQVRVNADEGAIELLEPVFGNKAPVSPASRDLRRVAAASLRRGPGNLGR